MLIEASVAVVFLKAALVIVVLVLLGSGTLNTEREKKLWRYSKAYWNLRLRPRAETDAMDGSESDVLAHDQVRLAIDLRVDQAITGASMMAKSLRAFYAMNPWFMVSSLALARAGDQVHWRCIYSASSFYFTG